MTIRIAVTCECEYFPLKIWFTSSWPGRGHSVDFANIFSYDLLIVYSETLWTIFFYQWLNFIRHYLFNFINFYFSKNHECHRQDWYIFFFNKTVWTRQKYDFYWRFTMTSVTLAEKIAKILWWVIRYCASAPNHHVQANMTLQVHPWGKHHPWSSPQPISRKSVVLTWIAILCMDELEG